MTPLDVSPPNSESSASYVRHWLLLTVLVLLLVGTGIGLRDPWPADEPRFAQIAQEMVESGEWLLPRIGGHLYPDKPPLFMWAIAVSYLLTGHMSIAFLLPSLLAALGTVYLTYDLGRRLWGPRAGLMGAILLAFTVQFAVQGRTAQIDAFLCFWATLAFYGLARHVLLGPQWRWCYAAFAAMGLGIITKGVGFLPVFALIPFVLARAMNGSHLAPVPIVSSRWLWAPLVLLGAVGVWGIPMLLAVAFSSDPAYAAYRDDLLFRQTVERYARSWGHIKPPWYYLTEVIPLFWFPLSVLLFWLVPRWWRQLRVRDGRFVVLLGYVGLVVLFFSLSPGKRGLYVLPALPVAVLAAAPMLPTLWAGRAIHYLSWSLVLVFGLTFAGAAAYFLWIDPSAGVELVAKHQFEPWPALIALAAAALLAVLARRPSLGGQALLAWLLAMWLVYGLWVYPNFDSVRSGRALMQEVAQRLGDGGELGLVDWREQFLYQADRPVVNFGFRARDRRAEVQEAINWLRQGDQRWVLMPDEHLSPCFDSSAAEFVGLAHRERWYLVNAQIVLPCPDQGTPSGQ